MSNVVGIDLGTTNSVIAVVEGGEPVVIPSAEGGRTVPSMVAFGKDAARLVGQTAKRQATINPENTIFSVKRFIGRNFNDPVIASEQRDMPYPLIQGPTGDVRVHIEAKNREYTPQEISAMVLAKLKNDAEAYLGEPVHRAVITVPAYFNDSQRQATKDAGKIAGLDVMRIINEPTAAALAYGLNQSEEQTILVFDLGGGTFDVSVLEISDGVIEVLATNGDTHLGGDDWDRALVKWIIDAFKREQGIDLSTDRQALQRVRESAEKAKIELSSALQTEINLPFITADVNGPKHLQMSLTRAEFEQLTEHLLHRIEAPINKALSDADIVATSSLDAVVMVGGSTRMPMVQARVASLTGQTPNRSVNPDEVVALGAALQAGVLAGDVKDVLLLDVTPLSLGLETLGGVMTTLIQRNTTIPTRKTETFSTAEDNQTAVDVKVLQGERTMANDNTVLGIFRLAGMPPAPRGIPKVEVTFDIDSNGILSVSAIDKATGRTQSVKIEASTNLSQHDIERMVQEAEQNSAEDARRRNLITARNTADQTIYQAEKLLAEQPDAAATLRKPIESAVFQLREQLHSDDAAQIEQLVSRLQTAMMSLGQTLYKEGDGADGPISAENSTVIDGEFEAA